MDSRRFPFVWPSGEGGSGNDALERELARDPALMMAQDALRTALGRPRSCAPASTPRASSSTARAPRTNTRSAW